MLAKVGTAVYEGGSYALSGLSYSARATGAMSMGISGGSTAVATGAIGSTAWMFAGFIYTAKTGLEYRRYKKG